MKGMREQDGARTQYENTNQTQLFDLWKNEREESFRISDRASEQGSQSSVGNQIGVKKLVNWNENRPI